MASDTKEIGKWAFVFGVIIAIIGGIVAIPAMAWILLVLGLIVGFLNVTAKETTEFLVATIALIVITLGAGGLGSAATVGAILAGVFQNIVTFIGPAALVVALKAMYTLGEA